jgi:hypothetical protein
MTDLTIAIRKQGLYCKACNKPMETTYISEKEAKAILKMIKGVFIKAINNQHFDTSSTEFPYKREHQEEGLNLAIKAIEDIE